MSADGLEIDVSGVVALASRFEGASAVVEAELTTAMQRSVLAVQRDAMALSPVDTGTLRRGWTTAVTPLEGIVANNVPYAPYVEHGRPAGSAPPPPGALLGWMGRHGIDASAEFQVARAIGRRGIPGKRMAAQALERNAAGIRQEFELAGQRIASRLGGSS